ncbi:XdhC family protein [Nesterenkonia sandarakina]|uniref:Xanthine dehydrogenase accessory factor n=1 Tax=Nesterenkonia sandarakina TaxID=272918 RepID=A0A2T0YIH6_9MICC|nr:XdhC/CoxI family protein [Nesterenkonia sandarakina]PRZ14941.1 xanthine dehydrogenase accessory factor [Nesterenkonia sandarakina]
MLDRISSYLDCFEDPENWAVATIVSVRGSSPSPVGTSMAVSADLRIIGSLSGGCVESAVAASAQDAIAAGGIRRESFGPDGTPFGAAGLGVALTCGGEIEVLIQPLATADLATMRELARQDPRNPATLTRDLEAADGSRFTVAERRAGAPRLILSGVHDFSFHLAQLGVQAGWRVELVDIRPAFATLERVPAGAELHLGHPASVITDLLRQDPDGESWTGICVMTHHPDLDVPVLDAALRWQTPPSDDDVARCFIGAMGSRSSAARRDAALAELGHSRSARDRVVSPLGLDLGAQTPAEAAVSMMAQLIAAKNAPASGAPLTRCSGPINISRPRTASLIDEMAV